MFPIKMSTMIIWSVFFEFRKALLGTTGSLKKLTMDSSLYPFFFFLLVNLIEQTETFHSIALTLELLERPQCDYTDTHFVK